MRLHPFGLLLALLAAGTAFGQTLLCPTPPAPLTHACDTFHYHVQLYRPDTRGFVELYGINQFASLTACERARDAAVARNAAVIDFYRKRNDQRYEPDRAGPCHCDMTVEKTSSNYLTDALRAVQLKLAAEVRMRVRERLMDADVPTDSELIRPAPPAASPLGGPRFVPLPTPSAAINVTNAPSDLKTPKLAELSSTPTLDLPLADPLAPAASKGVADVSSATVAEVKPQPPPQPASQQPPPTPTPPPQPATQPLEPKPEAAPVDDAADVFISVETDRIQRVLAASSAITDESVRAKVFEACTQRILLLSNLRALIEGSGAKSRLASAARAARAEADRLSLVAKLFGGDMPAHWAPKDARDVVVELLADAERLLRDSKTTAEQKRHALYSFLATTQLTDDQQLWIGSVVEGLL